ncbi:MAG: T9SS type A sorting domain-containing protein, partial [Niastella sp.]|uniref:T9SS type A sorting domain-containing protein n=1 Tax=Niastella sp. TaxID=1869183 RepID=UPI00389A2728
TSGKLVITGINNSNNAVITILDQSGRTIQEIRSASYEASGRIDLDVSALQNGVYFVKIQTLTQTITKKIVVSK